ncbi:MAG: helix-turn-helix transcriptional regulator, partial [Clostridiales bacterium]|nr:helix-turn-helix transcriptional regulator [Clostridiales bacterium]
IHSYIIDQRMEKAASLIIESNLPICQIASLVGYDKPSNFTAAFKKKYGVVPKQYKKEKI